MIAPGDRGSGSLLGLAIAGAIAAVVSLTLPLYSALALRERIAGAADAAALAGAGVESGISPGIACTVAATVAAANGSRLAACEVDGLVVTVRLDATFMDLPLTAIATAGPPPEGTN